MTIKKRPHPADAYNKRREIILKSYVRGVKQREDLDDLYEKLLQWIKNYQYVKELPLDRKSVIGLQGELYFFHHKLSELNLTPGGDFGDKCDFVGQDSNGKLVHFDVTTNVKVKAQQYDDFAELMTSFDRQYVIAEIKDINKDPVFYPLPLPCPDDDGGRIFHSLVLSKYDAPINEVANSVQIKKYCSYDLGSEETLYQIDTWEELSKGLEEYYFDGESYIEVVDGKEEVMRQFYNVSNEEEALKRIEEHYSKKSRYYEKQFDVNIGTIAEEDHHMVGYKGEQFEYGDKVVWTSGWAREFIYDMTDDII